MMMIKMMFSIDTDLRNSRNLLIYLYANLVIAHLTSIAVVHPKLWRQLLSCFEFEQPKVSYFANQSTINDDI